MSKQRLTVTVDREAAAGAMQAVKNGTADSLSSWVNEALLEKTVRERRLKSLDEAIGEFEKAHGAFSAEELAVLQRGDAERASVVRGPSGSRARTSKPGSRRGAA